MSMDCTLPPVFLAKYRLGTLARFGGHKPPFSCLCFPHVSKMSVLTFNWASSFFFIKCSYVVNVSATNGDTEIEL